LKSLRIKLILVFILAILSLVSLIIIYSYKATKDNYTNTLTVNLKNLNTAIIPLIKPYLLDNKFDSLKIYVNELGLELNTRITLVDVSGKVLADSKFQSDKMENHYQRKEIKDVILSKNFTSIVRHSTTLDKDMLYLGMPITHKGNLLGVSRVSIFLQDINRLNFTIIEDIISITITALIITIIIIIIITNNITKPLKQLAVASRKIALGDFDNRIDIKTKDEIRELGVYFNQMTVKLSKLFNELKTQKDSYTTLISSLLEGLIVTDLKGNIQLANRASNRIFNKELFKDTNLIESVNNEEFVEFVEDSIKNMTAQRKEIQINSVYYLCSSNLTESKEEIIFILYNINDIKKLDQLKKDFIVNVSHELRTPLTSIKGYIETLEEDSDEQSLKYIEIIRRNTDRLINIVQDLLSLSELENYSTKLQLSRTDIRVICDNVIKLLEPKANGKGLKLILQIEEGFPKLKIDPFKIEQLFINLIDNSIKYTDNGFVKLFIYQKDSNAILEVSDSGYGIPVEHHSRVFERFYTVDKSRSKKVGGTGLGLSIVKHIVLLHQGEINIDSNYTSGTKFIIQLPLKNK